MLTRQFTEEQASLEAYRRFLAEEVVPHGALPRAGGRRS